MFDMPPTQGLWLGGIVIIATLFIWHIFVENKWTIKLQVIAFMAVESVGFAIPLVVVWCRPWRICLQPQHLLQLNHWEYLKK